MGMKFKVKDGSGKKERKERERKDREEEELCTDVRSMSNHEE